MDLTRSDVKKIACLAHISLSREEEDSMKEDLSRILSHFQKLDELDLERIESENRGMCAGSALREDRILPSLSREEALCSAPDVKMGYVAVPRIISLDSEGGR
jgi:aspartyl-tRNA(Asn)/glutamyl-tRNA(Gln) amidotransferase subunit C